MAAFFVGEVGWVERSETQHNPCKPFQISYLQTRETSFTPTGENIGAGV